MRFYLCEKAFLAIIVMLLFKFGAPFKSTPTLKRSLIKRFLTVNIIVVGRKNGAEDWISDGCAEYEKRLTNSLNIHTTFVKSNEDLIKHAGNAKGTVLALDESGKEYGSIEFSKLVYTSLEKGGANMAFVIGGFAGLPQEIKQKYPLISLSKMTWTHQMVRLLLTEQIYRAAEIRKGSSYHKE